MASFLYFVSTDKPLTNLAAIAELGLSYAFDTMPTVAAIPRGATPNGKPGFLLADESRMNGYSVFYRPKEQTWRTFGDVSIGYYNDSPPTPKELLHQEHLPGRVATLADGNDWIVPVIYLWEGTDKATKLPKFLDVDDDGNFREGSVIEKYLPLVERISPWFDMWVEAAKKAVANDTEFTVDYKPEDCAFILGHNYRVGPRELAMRRVLQAGVTAAVVLWVACDLNVALDYLVEASSEKKSGELTSDTLPTAAGHAA